MLKKLLIAGVVTLVTSKAWAFGPGVTLEGYYARASADVTWQEGVEYADSGSSGAGYASVTDSVDGNGYGARGVFKSGLGVIAGAEYEKQSLDDNYGLDDFEDRRAGLGYEFDVTPLATFYGRADYVSMKFDDQSENGFGVYAGGDIGVLGMVSVYGRAGYVNVNDVDGPEAIAGVAISTALFIKFFAEYHKLDLKGSGSELDLDEGRIGVRFSFNS